VTEKNPEKLVENARAENVEPERMDANMKHWDHVFH